MPFGQSSFVPLPISELAKLFPQLEILECLGRGGMGAVYKARQPRLDRFVALKILAPEKQNDLQFAERFEREARALARLNHPNIVTVFDFGEVSGQFYLLMEFVDGLTLRQLLQAGKIAPAEALNIVPKICEALQFAHEQGIVHRDIKPENILMDKQGRVKIADFGIAKIAGLESKDFSLTGAKDVMGTPHYMAPEQIEKPLTVDHRADIYSLGVVFYEMLTGELPLGKFAPPSQKVQMDVRLDEVVLHALEKEPARRYQQASQVKTAVETIAGTPAPLASALAAGAPPLASAPAADASDKIILPAFLLAFFFGMFGAHRFYVGKYGTAVLQICTCGGFGIWATIDWILLVCGVFTDAQGRRMRNWIHPGPPAASVGIAPASTGAASGRFWRNAFIVVGCILLAPFVLLFLVAVAGIMFAAFGRAADQVEPLTAQELQQAGIRQENGEFRKESSQSFPLNADGRFSIDNVNGRIEIHGWSSNAVVWHAAIHGRTGEAVNAVKIKVHSEPGQVEIHTDLGDHLDSGWNWLRMIGRDKASVAYVVQVPQHAQLTGVHSVDGRIAIEGMAGPITASVVDGAMEIKNAADNLKLSAVDGSIFASVDSLGSGQSVSLHTVDGGVTLALPDGADARFSVHTIDGGVTSEFPELQPKMESVVGHNLKGTLGKGSAEVTVHTVDGAVRLVKNPAPSANAVERPDSTQLFYEWRGTGWVAISNHDFRVDSPAVSAAKKWLTLVDAGNISESWKETATFVQGKKTEAEWSNYLNTNRTALGKLISRQLVASIPLTLSNGVPTSPAVSGPITASPPIAPDGPYVFMRFQSSFAEKKDAKEDVTFSLEKDGQWRAVSYFIK